MCSEEKKELVWPWRIAALLGALAVALGAFGAHSLAPLLEQTGRLEVWKTAAIYHLAHAVLLVVLCALRPFPHRAWWLMASGVVLFSGSLYLLCLTQRGWIGSVTPVGGLLLLTGWLVLAWRRPSTF
ncbi:MAG: DUF423 domain-containing protein [Candidatus Methylacidiphilales bacterium]